MDWLQKFTIGRDGFYGGEEENEYNQAYDETKDDLLGDAFETLKPLGIGIVVVIVLLLAIKFAKRSNKRMKLVNEKKTKVLKNAQKRNEIREEQRFNNFISGIKRKHREDMRRKKDLSDQRRMIREEMRDIENRLESQIHQQSQNQPNINTNDVEAPKF